jgi:hypothetical protein
MRFVPLATPMGRPNTIKRVIEIMAPPPASVFITPTMIPDTTSIMIIIRESVIGFLLSSLRRDYSQFGKNIKKIQH